MCIRDSHVGSDQDRGQRQRRTLQQRFRQAPRSRRHDRPPIPGEFAQQSRGALDRSAALVDQRPEQIEEQGFVLHRGPLRDPRVELLEGRCTPVCVESAMQQGQTMAILVGGGPAPGINGVIASATIEAINNGLRVVGIYDGYRALAAGETPQTIDLHIEDVSRIHMTGGSILRTSRTNPAKSDQTLDNCVAALDAIGARYVVAIGGDDTTYGAARIAARAAGRIGIVTVPKTIDNDLPLPDNAPTFGFETARSVGTSLIESLLEDARTTARWYL